VTHGSSSLKLNGVSVSQANDLLGASYQLYRHAETNETIPRTVSYAFPAALPLHGHVQTVAPMIYFASSHTALASGSLSSSPQPVRVAFNFLSAQYTIAGTGRSPHDYTFAGPYVITVGGTTSLIPEVAASLSGDGFSNYFPTRPDPTSS